MGATTQTNLLKTNLVAIHVGTLLGVDPEGMDEVARPAEETMIMQDPCVSCVNPLVIEWLSFGSLLKL